MYYIREENKHKKWYVVTVYKQLLGGDTSG